MLRHGSVVLLAAVGLPSLVSAAPIAEPHPLITEVLAAVPSGPKGDANADGVRDALGDEFIELVNPHGKPINLKGYTLVDAEAYNPGAAKPDPVKPTPRPPTKPSGRTPDGRGRPGAAPADASGGQAPSNDPKGGNGQATSRRGELRFTFPDLELKPGEVVVVFNGYKSQMSGPVGTSQKAPDKKHERFHDAWIFSMRNESPYVALGNEADMVVLLAPDGSPVQCVRWGKNDKNPPSAAALIEEAPVSKGSVQRDGVDGALIAHRDLKGDLAGTPCSPGLFSLTPTADSADKPQAAKPAQPAKPEDPKSTRPGAPKPGTGRRNS